jgi:hypothetical protein
MMRSLDQWLIPAFRAPTTKFAIDGEALCVGVVDPLENRLYQLLLRPAKGRARETASAELLGEWLLSPSPSQRLAACYPQQNEKRALRQSALACAEACLEHILQRVEKTVASRVRFDLDDTQSSQRSSAKSKRSQNRGRRSGTNSAAVNHASEA